MAIRAAAAIIMAGVAIATWGCGGGGGAKQTPTPGAAATSTPRAATPTASSGSTAPTSAAAAPTPAEAAAAPTPAAAAPTTAPPPPAPPAPPAGKTYTAEQATALVNAASLTPADLPAGWKIQSDTTTDNAAAAAADPVAAPGITRCVRLTGRTVTNFPADPIAAFIGGTTLSFFTTATAYATVDGAADCAIEAGVRFQQPGELAKAFGSVFVDPASVAVAPFTYAQVADGSFAATLTGKVNASGTTIDLTILIVAFRKGNVTAVVGSARSGQTPPAAELTPLVDRVIGRIVALQ